MWIKVKTKKEMPLEALLKEHKNTHIDVILQHPPNKAVAALHKAGKPVPKGTVVVLLDPTKTVYVSKFKGKQAVVSEAEYKESIKKANSAMDFALKRYKTTHESMVYRHDLQRKVNETYPIISFFTSNWVGSKGDEPTAQKKASAAAVKSLESVVKKRDYARFEPSVKAADDKVRAYGKGIDEWIEQHTGSSENWETGLTVLRDGSFTVFGVLAMTVAAPASVAAGAGYGALVGGGTSLMSSSANEVGRHFAGADGATFSGSVKKVATDVVKGTAFGAATAFIAGKIGQKIATKLAERLGSSNVMNAMLTRVNSPVSKKLARRVFERELQILSQRFPKVPVDRLPREYFINDVGQQVTAKVLIRGGVASTKTFVEKVILSGKGVAWVQGWLTANATKVKGNVNEEQLAAMVANQMITTDLAKSAMERAIAGNAKKIEAELASEFRARMEAEIRKSERKAGAD